MSFKTRCYIEERERVHLKDKKQEERKWEQWKEVSQLQLKSWERWECDANFSS